MRPLTRKERAGGIVAAFVTEGVAVYAYSDWRWSAETLVPSIDKDGARRFFVTGYLGTSERALRALTKLVEEAKP